MHAIQHLFPHEKPLLLRLGAVSLDPAADRRSSFPGRIRPDHLRHHRRGPGSGSYYMQPTRQLSLTEAGLELGEEDTFTTQSDGNVSEITVNRIQMVRVNHDGQALEVATYGSTVSGILEQLGISTEGRPAHLPEPGQRNL